MTIKRWGLAVKPTQDIATINVEHFSLWLPELKEVNLGHSSLSLRSSGCLIACLASALNEIGHTFNVISLNEKLRSSGVLNLQGDLIWMELNRVFPEVEYDYHYLFNARTFERDLTNGDFVFLKVKNYRSGRFHWLLLVGAQDREFLVMDSLCETDRKVLLSEYGRVFAYRRIYKTDK